MMKNILLKISYDGTDFSGWQRQPDKRTVCGELEALLERLLGEEIVLNGTSRTDSGVHAYGQCASFRADLKMPTENLVKMMNDALSEDRLESIGDIRIISATEMPDDFHARFSSKGKTYIYRIKNVNEPNVFDKNYFYQVSGNLDIGKMKRAAEFLVGEHDFAAFQSSGSPKESTVRTIYDLTVDANGNDITVTISGNGFLYNMVRIIVGTLVEAGLGKINPTDVKIILESCDRSTAGHTAPPQGLYLSEIYF